jgi:hypothetical protein
MLAWFDEEALPRARHVISYSRKKKESLPALDLMTEKML